MDSKKLPTDNTPFFSQFDPAQIHAGYVSSLKGLEKMRIKAKLEGRKVNGYSLAQLETLCARYRELVKTAAERLENK